MTPKEPDSRGLTEGVTSDPDYYEPYPEGAAGIDHCPLTYPFNGELPVMINPEFIYACAPRTTGDSPLWISSPYLLGGGNGLNLVQDLVDAFSMVDGQDINHSSTNYPYPDMDNNYLEIGGSNQAFSDIHCWQRLLVCMITANLVLCDCRLLSLFWAGTSSTDNNFRNKEVTYYSTEADTLQLVGSS